VNIDDSNYRKLVLKLMYDGTDFNGWQRQAKGERTVQGVLESKLQTFVKHEIIMAAAGRTDTGVHARGMVIDIQLLDDFQVPLHKLPKAMNSLLPLDIRVLGAMIVSQRFNSRFDALSRSYSYSLIKNPDVFRNRFAERAYPKFDVKIANKVAEMFLGDNDFTTFSKKNDTLEHYRSIVSKSYWEEVGENEYRYYIKANRFVYSMVRSLVGAMIDVGRGKRTIQDLEMAFISKDRSLASFLAPAKGLVFEEVEYDKKFGIEI